MNQPEAARSWSFLLFWFSAGLAALVLRIGASSLLMWRHGIDHGFEAWFGLWHEEPWPLAEGVRQLGLPWPEVLATIAVVFGLGACLLWVVGLLTRVAAIAMMFVLVGFGAWFWLADDFASVELTAVYMVITLSLFVMGSGPLSLDILFRRRGKTRPVTERRVVVTPAPPHGRGWLQ